MIGASPLSPSQPLALPSRKSASGGLQPWTRRRVGRIAPQPMDASGKNRPNYDGARRGAVLPQKQEPKPCQVTPGKYDPKALPKNLPDGWAPEDIGGGRTNVFMRNSSGALSLTSDSYAYRLAAYNSIMRSNTNVGAGAATGGVASLRFPALAPFSAFVGAVTAALSYGPPPPPPSGCKVGTF